MFEELIKRFPRQTIVIACHDDDQFREIYYAVDHDPNIPLDHRFSLLMANIHRNGRECAFSITMPGSDEPGRPKWDGWCDVGWYHINGYVVVDYEEAIESVQSFEPPNFSPWEEQT